MTDETYKQLNITLHRIFILAIKLHSFIHIYILLSFILASSVSSGKKKRIEICVYALWSVTHTNIHPRTHTSEGPQ